MFRGESGLDDAPENVRCALSKLKINLKGCDILREALTLIGKKFLSPGYSGDATAHVAVPSDHVALHVLRAQSSGSWVMNKRREWKAEGWRFLVVYERLLIDAGVESVAKTLQSEVFNSPEGVKSRRKV